MSNQRDAWTAEILKRAKPHKYGARKKVVDGITFDSTKEAKRYQELRLRERAGEIHGLVVQPTYPLEVLGVECRPIGIYRADFEYCECHRGAKCERTRLVVEDVKGVKTPLYRWKKKHVEAQYGIRIVEV